MRVFPRANADLPRNRRFGAGVVGGRRGGTEVTGGSGGLSGVGSPEGVVAAAEGSIYLNTSDGGIWWKQSGGATANGWVERLAGP